MTTDRPVGLKPTEAARVLRRSPAWVREEIRGGRLEGTRMGLKCFYLPVAAVAKKAGCTIEQVWDFLGYEAPATPPGEGDRQ